MYTIKMLGDTYGDILKNDEKIGEWILYDDSMSPVPDCIFDNEKDEDDFWDTIIHPSEIIFQGSRFFHEACPEIYKCEEVI